MFLLFFPSIAAAGYFSEHIANYLNDTIDPCDNFYDHVCSVAIPERRYLFIDGPERFKDFLRQTASPQIREFRLKVESDRSSLSNESTQPEDLAALEQFLSKENCSFECPLSKNRTCYDEFQFVEGVEAYDAYYRIQFTPHFNTLKKKMEEIYAVQKEILIKEFTKAVWTTKHEDFLSVLNSIPLRHVEIVDLDLEVKTEEVKRRYEECTKITYNSTRTLADKCLTYAVCPLRRQLYRKIMRFYDFAFSFDANWKKRRIIISPMFYTIEEDELPYMLGSIDLVISHEIGHTFFHGPANPSNSECLRKHMESSCNSFIGTVECENYNNIPHKGYDDDASEVYGMYSRFNDDASDWMGVHAGLKALETYFPSEFSQKSQIGRDVLKKTEIVRKFFYAYGITWCKEDPEIGNGGHSPPFLRVNGISSLFSEFTEVFECKRGSRMAKAGTCLPLAGAGAPTRKRH